MRDGLVVPLLEAVSISSASRLHRRRWLLSGVMWARSGAQAQGGRCC